MKYKVGVYVHFDPAAWEEEKHVSLKRQLRTIHSHIEKDPELEVEKTYLDENTGNDSAVFDEMIEDIDEGLIDCVVVRDVSVIGKSYLHGVDFVRKFCPFNEVRVIVVNSNYDSIKENVWNENKRKVFGRTLNEKYNREKFIAHRNKDWQEGKYNYGPVPYGYVRIDGRLYIDPETSKVVKNIFERYLRNDRAYTIAKDLRDLGVMSPKTYEHYLRTGEITDRYKWKDCTIWRILRSPYYVGDTVHT
ncbi:MAG: recombinase family protein, partial [Bacteroidaceae bacterium]|nr:recombinase family protein [Bacteroidaceae bacterium]